MRRASAGQTRASKPEGETSKFQPGGVSQSGNPPAKPVPSGRNARWVSDLMNGRSVKQKHAVEIRIENVEMIQTPHKGLHQLTFESSRGQEVGAGFSRDHQPWLNYYWRIFRAKAPTAKLTISDWTSADEPGGPVGQELIFNFIELQPYFAEE